MKYILLLFVIVGCTNSPSGAIEYRSISYYIDGRFHEEIPDEYIRTVWGHRITDAIGNEHTFRDSVSISHQRKETKWCTIHRQSEVVKAMYNGREYIYWVAKK